MGEHEADIKRLQEQLKEANQANEVSRAKPASQGSQSNQPCEASAASDANKALQEELSKLRQEVQPTFKIIYNHFFFLLFFFLTLRVLQFNCKDNKPVSGTLL